MTPEQFADTIQAEWRGSTEAVLRACKAAADARAAGCLTGVESELKARRVLDPSTLRRLAIIGERPDILAIGHRLPPRWGTIYELTKLKPTDLADKLRDDAINPSMERSTVTGWLRPALPTPTPTPTPAGNVVSLPDALRQLTKLRKDHKPSEFVGECKPAELRMAIAFLQAVADAQKAQQGSTP